jgi:dienelactone hydrolase
MPSSLARRSAALCFSALAATLHAEPARPPLIPAADFAEDPLMLSPSISPDGKHVLGTLIAGDKQVPGVLDLATGQLKSYKLPPKMDLRWARWAGSNHLLVSLQVQSFYYDYPVSASRLVALSTETPGTTYLGLREQGLRGDDILYVDPLGRYVLLTQNATIWEDPAVYRFTFDGAKPVKVVAKKDGVSDWWADSAGVVRVGMGVNGRQVTIQYRPNEASEFKRIDRIKLGDDFDNDSLLNQLAISPGSDEGYVLTSKNDGRMALYKYNYATRALGAQIFAAPENDVTGFDLSDDNKTIEAVYWTDDRDRVSWFDPNLKTYQAAIDKATAGKQAVIMSRSADNQRMIIYLGASNNPGNYYLFDVGSGVMNRLVAFAPKVPRSALAETKPVKYTARDGTVIPAYLTLPVGRAAKDLPLIIMPHGGPYGVRDTLSYDTDTQFLANRGYAVLQPNYRGSDGYGVAFYEKGEGQWGRAMQDDLDDGVDWLIKQGVADAKRVCIVGMSYGGYAALWGATRNPEHYRCAVSFAGISDVRKQLNYQSDFFYNRKYRANWQQVVKGEQAFDLASISPIQHVDQLRVPLLILHGDDDKTVPPSQSSDYVDALKKAGKTYEYKSYPGEQHGPTKAATRLDWLNRLEAFLAKYNPA